MQLVIKVTSEFHRQHISTASAQWLLEVGMVEFALVVVCLLHDAHTHPIPIFGIYYLYKFIINFTLIRNCVVN